MVIAMTIQPVAEKTILRDRAKRVAAPMNHAYLRMVDAIYGAASGDQAWLANVAGAAQEHLDDGLGVVAYTYDASDIASFKIDSIKSSSATPLLFADRVTAVAKSRPASLVRRIYRSSPSVVLLSDLLAIPRGSFQSDTTVRKYFPYGIEDAVAIRGADPSGRGCLLAVPLPRARPLPPRTRSGLARVAAHLAAGFRLRRSCTSSGERTPDHAEAIFTPRGNAQHLVSAVDDRVRHSLLDAIARREYAHSRHVDPARALELWTALISGQWSIVDYLDRDGKRFILAHRNEPDVFEPSALHGHEQRVAAYAALGHSNKHIAYELGLAPATVASHLSAALRKLKLRSRRELVQLLGHSA
jgi:DNA-binding NarL/FixJ family response regulator